MSSFLVPEITDAKGLIYIAGGGELITEAALAGGMSCTYFEKLGFEGIILGGAVRDKKELIDLDIPVIATNLTPSDTQGAYLVSETGTHCTIEHSTIIKLTDCFVMDTHNMLFASRFTNISDIKKIGSHPASRDLFQKIEELDNIEKSLFNSNAEAAFQCSQGNIDGCITTLSAANKYNLNILHDFGPVPMGFSIHSKLN